MRRRRFIGVYRGLRKSMRAVAPKQNNDGPRRAQRARSRALGRDRPPATATYPIEQASTTRGGGAIPSRLRNRREDGVARPPALTFRAASPEPIWGLAATATRTGKQ